MVRNTHGPSRWHAQPKAEKNVLVRNHESSKWIMLNECLIFITRYLFFRISHGNFFVRPFIWIKMKSRWLMRERAKYMNVLCICIKEVCMKIILVKDGMNLQNKKGWGLVMSWVLLFVILLKFCMSVCVIVDVLHVLKKGSGSWSWRWRWKVLICLNMKLVWCCNLNV